MENEDLKLNGEAVETVIENKETKLCSKFKSEEELAKAYSNLEAEFTRKSQKLKELEKELESVKPQTEQVKCYESENWQEQVASFLAENKIANEYAAEIANEILNNESIAKSENPLILAWQKIAASQFKPQKEIANDETFLNEYIFSKEEIKNKIIADFVKNQSKNFVPTLISNGQNRGFTVSKPNPPKTLHDASILAEKILNE